MGTVRVTLNKQAEDFHFLGTNASGHSVHIDDAGGYVDKKGSGVGPMQLLLLGLGGCSGVDVVSILKKGRCRIDRFDIEVVGQKPDGVSPSIYQEINIRYEIDGDVSPTRVRRAVELSLGKYCSVAATLGKSARIRFDYVVNGESFEGDWR